MSLLATYDHSTFPGTPWEQGRLREEALAAGLRSLAALYQLEFKPNLHIDSRGEFQLFLKDGQRYGEAFVAILNRHNPRTGYAPTKYMDPSNSWCMMNHFDVQRMLEEVAKLVTLVEGEPQRVAAFVAKYPVVLEFPALDTKGSAQLALAAGGDWSAMTKTLDGSTLVAFKSQEVAARVAKIMALSGITTAVRVP